MDPGFTGRREAKANLSPLMQAKSRAAQGEVINFCPFGCRLEELDSFGYCPHLAGFSPDGVVFEPMRLVQGRKTVVGAEAGKVKQSDRLERITTSYRVYRQVEDSTEAKEE